MVAVAMPPPDLDERRTTLFATTSVLNRALLWFVFLFPSVLYMPTS